MSPWVSGGRRAAIPPAPEQLLGPREPAWARPGRWMEEPAMPRASVVVGIDVSKAALDVAVRPSGTAWRTGNDAAGITALVAELAALAPTCVVLEATGGLERPATVALAAAGLPVAVVNPRQVRDFAKA